MNDLRKEIDKLDDQIIMLLEKRLEIVKAIGKLKKEMQIAVLDQSRETMIIDKISNLNLNNKEQIILIYQYLMTITKDMQNE